VKVPVLGPTPKRTLYLGGAAVAVIVVAAYIYRARRSSGTVVATDPATGTATGGGYVNPAPSRTLDPTVDNPDLIQTDADWSAAVAPMLISADWDAQYVYLTLGAYLAGEQLDTNQAALIRAAWGMKGRPPSNREIVMGSTGPAPGGGGTPAPDPTPAPPQERIYTFKSGDTLSRVAALYGMTAGQLYNFGTNALSLENYAHEHGLPSSEGGRYIWPGYQIGVPA
jgi:hypothetical protein